MRWIKLVMAVVVVGVGGPTLAADPSSVSAGLIVPKKGKSDGETTSSKPVYMCIVSDWSKPLRRSPTSSFIEKRPPAGDWSCDPPRKSGGYTKSDVGAACACDAYGDRWAGKIEAL